MVYGYARVSTKDQKISQQIEQLQAFGVDKIFKEKVTGTSIESRKEFQKLLDIVQPGDKIVVCKLDRFARSLKDAIKVVEILNSKNVGLVVLNMAGGTLDTSSPTGKLMFNMLMSIAEFEVELMKERQRAGIEQAKKRGVYKGRPRKYTEKHVGLNYAIKLFNEREENKLTVKEICQITRVSRATLYRAIQKQAGEKVVD